MPPAHRPICRRRKVSALRRRLPATWAPRRAAARRGLKPPEGSEGKRDSLGRGEFLRQGAEGNFLQIGQRARVESADDSLVIGVRIGFDDDGSFLADGG